MEHERTCKDDVLYREACDDWYPKFCVDEHGKLHPFVAANRGGYIGDACEQYINKTASGARMAVRT